MQARKLTGFFPRSEFKEGVSAMKHNQTHFFNRGKGKGRGESFALCCISAFAVFTLLFSCVKKDTQSANGGLRKNRPYLSEGRMKGAIGAADEVVVWTYDSFVSEWGPGEQVAGKFAEEEGIVVKWESAGDAGSLLARLLLEGKDAKADVILGLDQNLMGRALQSDLFEAYKPQGAEQIFAELVVDNQYKLTPFDYSYFAIIMDTEKIKDPPRSLEDISLPAYNNSLILMDPRTSSPGLGFLAWTITVYGTEWPAYWERLKASILTIAPGWDTGYGLFSKGEAPLVLSYTTSPGYHLEYEGTERYRAALFTEGHPAQIELAGLLKNAPHKENAKRFLDFMLTENFQSMIPLTNWMYPVIDIPLPASYSINTKPARIVYPAPVSEEVLNKWVDIMQ
jgi:thiamine transport system substrate-binding protein